MLLGGYFDRVRRDLVAAAAAGGDDARAVAERLVAPLESTVRLTLLEALSAAADEITRELAPGSVHLRLRGLDPDFVVDLPPAEPPAAPATAAPAPTAVPDPADPADGPVSRINFRPPENLKTRIEEAANREGLSVNAWLVRATTAALDPPQRRTRHDPDPHATRFTGWVG